MTAAKPDAAFALDIVEAARAAMTGNDLLAPYIRRDLALQVTAVLRARNILCGPLGTLPIRVHAPDRSIVDPTKVQYLVPSPDPDVAHSVMMALTVEDLLFEGIAWWRVTKRGWHGYPVNARHVPVSSVSVQPVGGLLPSQVGQLPDQKAYPVDGRVFIDGVPVDDIDIIRFDSPNPPLLRAAARSIRTCLLLDKITATYANDPVPLGYFSPEEGVPQLSDKEIERQIAMWDAARHKKSWGFLQGLKLNPVQWNPEQLQLAAQRQHAVLEIARATGLDAEDLQVSITSRTYANQEQRWQALINTTLGPYVSAVQDRLSMRDILPRGYTTKFDFGGFLRGDTKTRMETYKTGREVGAYDDERIASLEDIPLKTVQSAARQRKAAQPPVTRDASTAGDSVT